MRVIGVHRVALSSLYLDGMFMNRLQDPRIDNRAKSIGEHTLLYEPLVRESDMRVIDGRDRVAAEMKRGSTEIDVKLLECTDEECEVLERVTTIERRHDPEEQQRCLDELVDIYQKRLEGETRKGKNGRPKKPRAAAREEVAAVAGVKADTLRKREERKRKRAEVAVPDLLPVDPPIRTLGMDLSDEWLAEVLVIQKSIDEVTSLLQRAQGALTVLEGRGLAIPAGVQRLKEDVHDCASAARGLRPESLCPHCKGLESVQEICLCCVKLGFITEAQVPQIPKPLWNEETPVVTVAGRLTKVSDVVAANDVTKAWGLP